MCTLNILQFCVLNLKLKENKESGIVCQKHSMCNDSLTKSIAFVFRRSVILISLVILDQFSWLLSFLEEAQTYCLNFF